MCYLFYYVIRWFIYFREIRKRVKMSTIYALVKKMNLVLIFMCIVQVPRVSCQDMRFVYPIKDMSVSTEKDEFPMTFRMNISSDISFVLGLLENIKTELAKIEKNSRS